MRGCRRLMRPTLSSVSNLLSRGACSLLSTWIVTYLLSLIFWVSLTFCTSPPISCMYLLLFLQPWIRVAVLASGVWEALPSVGFQHWKPVRSVQHPSQCSHWGQSEGNIRLLQVQIGSGCCFSGTLFHLTPSHLISSHLLSMRWEASAT